MGNIGIHVYHFPRAQTIRSVLCTFPVTERLCTRATFELHTYMFAPWKNATSPYIPWTVRSSRTRLRTEATILGLNMCRARGCPHTHSVITIAVWPTEAPPVIYSGFSSLKKSAYLRKALKTGFFFQKILTLKPDFRAEKKRLTYVRPKEPDFLVKKRKLKFRPKTRFSGLKKSGYLRKALKPDFFFKKF